MTLPQVFQQVRRALDSAGVIYAIGGSWASTIHGEPRHTNAIDFVTNFDASLDASLDAGCLQRFFNALGSGFYFDPESALASLKARRPFNIIHQELGYKFDFFPAIDSHGTAELARRMAVALPALDTEPVPVISAEDTILAKLRWYRAGGEVSERQWRDIAGMFAASGDRLDRDYLERWAETLGLTDLYQRAAR